MGFLRLGRIMADAVDPVRAYLHVNGYFTVTEYPVLEQLRAGGHRTVTDLDLLAVRFAGAGPVAVTSQTGRPVVPVLLEPDPVLGADRRESDMIVAEVKEGRAELNKGGARSARSRGGPGSLRMLPLERGRPSGRAPLARRRGDRTRPPASPRCLRRDRAAGRTARVLRNLAGTRALVSPHASAGQLGCRRARANIGSGVGIPESARKGQGRR